MNTAAVESKTLHALGASIYVAIRTVAFVAVPVAIACAIPPQAASACGSERWASKTLADGAALDPVARIASVGYLRSLNRKSVDSTTMRVGVERHRYRIRAELLAFRLEPDDDIHLILAQPGKRNETIIGEIPDPKCLRGTSRTYARDIALARLAFVRAFGIPPVLEFRLAYRSITVDGFAFFDYDHGQSGAPPNQIELHPVLKIAAGGASLLPAPAASAAPRPAPAHHCPGDVIVWANSWTRVYHLWGSRWYGRTRRGQYMCRMRAEASGYHASLR
jgi:hypothetical protein